VSERCEAGGHPDRNDESGMPRGAEKDRRDRIGEYDECRRDDQCGHDGDSAHDALRHSRSFAVISGDR
jgi:hypothetical protein